MLLAVVSLKCSLPSVTLVILPLGRLTLEDGHVLFLECELKRSYFYNVSMEDMHDALSWLKVEDGVYLHYGQA